MPDLVAIANDLKTAPDQWLVHESQNPSGPTPPYLVLSELQRRQLLRGGQDKPPNSSVQQDTLAATIKQISPPTPQGPPPPPGMAPPPKGMPGGDPGGPIPGAKPPQNFARGGRVGFDDGGEVDDQEDDPAQLYKMTPPDLINYFSKKFKINPAIPLAIAGNETHNFDTKAVSPKGAGGMFQLMPETARELGVTDVFDPVQNTRAGVQYAKKMLDQHRGNVPLALAAYNSGPGTVKRYGGIPPYRETQDYVRKAMAKIGRQAQASPSPFTQGRADLLPQGEIEQTDDSGAPISNEPPAPGPLPNPQLADRAPGTEMADAPPPPTGLAATPEGAAASEPWKAPDTDEMRHARARMESASAAYSNRSKADQVSSAVQVLREKRPDYDRLEAAIAELTGQVQQEMRPSIGATLRTMGFALLASHSPSFGQALGEAGLMASGQAEKQRQAARQNYIELLKAGVDLQEKRSAYDERAAQIGLNETRLNQAETERLRKEAEGAQKEFDRLAATSPAGQAEQRRNSVMQFRAQNGTTGPLTSEEQAYIQFGTKPVAARPAQDSMATLAKKAAGGDKEAQAALKLLGHGEDTFDQYLNPGKAGAPAAAPAAIPGAPAAAPAAPAGPLAAPPIPANSGRNEALLQNLEPAEAQIIRNIADYRVPLPTGRALTSGAWPNRLKAVAMYDPSFNQSFYNIRQKVQGDFAPSGKSGQSINKLNTVTQHLDRLEGNWAKLNNWPTDGTFGILGAIGNYGKNEYRALTHDRRFTSFAADQEATANELMRLWREVGASEQEVKAWKDQLSVNAPPETQAAAIQEMYHLVGGKLASIKNGYEQSMGRPADFHMLTPDAAKRFQSHGVDYRDLDPGYALAPGGAGAPGSSPAPPAAGGKVVSRAKVQQAATEKFNGNYDAAAKAFTDRGYAIQ